MSKTLKNGYKTAPDPRACGTHNVLSALRRMPENKNNEGQPVNKLRLSLSVILYAVLVASTAQADVVFDSVGIVEADAVKKFDGLRQHGLVLTYRVRSESNRFWVPSSLDLSAGWLERASDTSNYVSFGPSYRINLGSGYGRWFADFGSHPTYIGKSSFDRKPLGGSFFFTSYLGVGAYLDSQQRMSFLLRYQHTSNAGIDGDNPGVDMIGLTFSYHFAELHRLASAENSSK